MSEVEAVEAKTESRSIILTNAGVPFGTENAANLAMHKKGYTLETHSIIAYEGGFAIVAKHLTPPAATSPVKVGGDTADNPKPGLKYYRVRFHGKTNPQDDDQVKLGANGPLLLITREKPVVLSETFLEVARNANYIKYDFTPGNERKHPVKIMKYPFDILGEATEAEFMEMLRGGGAIQGG